MNLQMPKLKDVSVYGPGSGFRGFAKPGRAFLADLAFEYSFTETWVLALDTIYEHDGSTGIRSYDAVPTAVMSTPVQTLSGSRDAFSLAPALEYNWNEHVGVIAGVAATVAARNVAATIMPVVGIGMIY
jgi:hypothetical protein